MGGPSGNAIRSVLGCDFGSEGSSFCCRNATLQGFPPLVTGKAAIPSFCGTTLSGRDRGVVEPGGSGHVDRHVCRDDCISERHGARAEPGAAGGGQGPASGRRGVSRRTPRNSVLPKIIDVSGAEVARSVTPRPWEPRRAGPRRRRLSKSLSIARECRRGMRPAAALRAMPLFQELRSTTSSTPSLKRGRPTRIGLSRC